MKVKENKNVSVLLTEKELQQALQVLFKKAQTDAKFRALCLANPHQAIFELTGKKLPGNAKLKFTE